MKEKNDFWESTCESLSLHWNVLTLCFHCTFVIGGFALTEHSKYTSSPSFILSGSSDFPRETVTRGISENLRNILKP